MPLTSLRRITTLAMVLALGVVMLGAYTRLTGAGLGCPDWPGCYGHLMVSVDVIDGQKAWTEMAHRYVAGTLGLLILSISLLVGKSRLEGTPVPWKLPLG
ncbi:MAG: COX15/CtaA family protein, partial [Legionellales bacterium]|nr:COX15/CtaA family protein [Legionellales bacterium]